MLFLWFYVDLEAAHYPRARHGPVFSRWLPDGRNDLLELPTGDREATLEIWFERCGYTDEEGFTHFDASRSEIDPTAIRTQGGLEAGNLFGLLRLSTVDSAELDCVQNSRHGEEPYLELGKRVVRTITPPVSRVIALMQAVFGQFWLPGLEPFDSRKWSLGSYCSDILHLKWSSEEDGGRRPFLPNLDSAWSEIAVASTSADAFMQYLVDEDWGVLKALLQGDYETPLAAQLLVEARSRMARKDLRAAIAVGTTALDLAIENRFRQLLQGSEKCIEKGQSFYDLKLAQKTVFLGPAIGIRDKEAIEQCLDAIRSRNDIVHEGADPKSIPDSQWDGLFKVTAAFLGPPSYKLPPLDIGILTAPERIWDE